MTSDAAETVIFCDTHAEYKGFAVTIRCRELRATSQASLFSTTYSVMASDAVQASWQRFIEHRFQTADTAAAYALAAAQESIDARILGQHTHSPQASPARSRR